jgi:hypothetical protein
MADRFPSIDDLDLGKTYLQTSSCRPDFLVGDNPPSTAPAEGSFLDRERAALGEDANQFATEQDRTTTSATVQDGEDDLLGEDVSFREIQPEAATTQEDFEFENSYPAIDTQNQVRTYGTTLLLSNLADGLQLGCCARWKDHRRIWNTGNLWLQELHPLFERRGIRTDSVSITTRNLLNRGQPCSPHPPSSHTPTRPS